MKWQWILSMLAIVLLIAFSGSRSPAQSVGQAGRTRTPIRAPTRTLTPTVTPTPTFTVVAPPPPSYNPRVEMSVQPAMARPGELVTLTIRYVDLGVPYTYLTINPPDLLAFDPPVTMPCKYHGNLSDCTTFTMRALAGGKAWIHADVEGEIFDYSCHCWRYTWVYDGIEVFVGWQTYFPMIGVR